MAFCDPFFEPLKINLTLVELSLFLSIVLFVRQTFKNRHFNKLASAFPGPTPLPIVGSALKFFNCNTEQILSVIIELGRSYRFPVFKFYLGSKLLVFARSPEALQIVLNSPYILEKTCVYDLFKCTLGDGILTAPAKKWKKSRKMVNPAFRIKLLEKLMPILNEEVAGLIQKLEPHCGSGSELDIWPHVRRLSMDAVCHVTLGIKTNAKDDLICGFIDALDRFQELTSIRMSRVWLHSDFIYNKTGEGKEVKNAAKILREIPEKLIQERKEEFIKDKTLEVENNELAVENSEKLNIFLDILLEWNHQDPESFSEKDLLDEVVTFMIASESSGITICFCLLMLAMHPEIQDKVFEEQFSIFRGEDRPATINDLGKMIYTEQVIKETLRLFPPGPLFFREVEQDTYIDESHTIPGGASVFISPFLTHTDPDLWPDPDKFNPDNFCAENLIRKHKYAFIPFSGGPRGCIASKFAMLSIKTTISTFLRNYEVFTATRPEDVKLQIELHLHSSNGWNMRLEPRTHPKPTMAVSSED